MINKKKVIIFGASLYGKIAYKKLSEEFQIVAFADNAQEKWNKEFCGQIIIPPQKILEYDKVTVIIASQYYYSIGRQLKKLQVKDIKVFFYKGALSEQQYYEDDFLLLESDFEQMYSNVLIDYEKGEQISYDFSYNYAKNKRKKVLFFAYYFPPIGGSGVQRSLKFVKYLKQFGYEPIVVAPGKVVNDTIDDTLLLDIPDDVKVIRIDNEFFGSELVSLEEQQEIINLYFGVVKSKEWISNYIKIVQESFDELNNILIPDTRVYWVNQVLKTIENEINLQEIDIVFTSGSPYSILLLGYYIKNKYNIPWVMEDRDAWIANDYLAEMEWFKGKYITYDLEKELNHRLLENVDRLIVIAEQIVNDYVDKFSVDRNLIRCITNGYDEDDFVDLSCEKCEEKFTICYNGWIYLDRNPLQLLQVINELIDNKQMDAEKTQWIFNGNVQREMKESLLNSDKYHILQFNGYLEHGKSLSIAAGADMLVLFGGIGNGTKVMYTGKLFEYLRLQRPILGFSTPGGVFDDVFGKTGCGKNFDYDDIDGVKEYLLMLYKNWQNGQDDFKPNVHEIACYERRELTRELAEVFRNILEN